MTENVVTYKKYEQPEDTYSFVYANAFGWNFFVVDTNFPISCEIADLIEEIEGIESLEILSRYKCRVSVGQNFNEDIVLSNMQERIYGLFEDKQPSKYKTLFDGYKEQSNTKYFAAVFIEGDKPNTILVSENTKKEAEEKLTKAINENKNNESKVIKTWKN